MTLREIITIERLAPGGLGLARLKGRIVFLPGVLPGEEVAVEVIETKADYLRARPIEVLTAHAARVDPVCPHFMVCGGCQLMHASYALQLELKAAAAVESLRREGEGPAPITASPHPLFYRDRARLHLALVRERLTPGFHTAKSRRLIPIRFCHQLHPRLNLILPALAAWTERMSGLDGAPTEMEVLAGAPTERVIVRLTLSGRPSRPLARIIASGPDHPDAPRIFTAFKDRNRPADPRDSGEGLTWLRLRDPVLRLEALPGVFTQVNPGLNRLLVLDVLALARQAAPERVLDLYAGLGNFTLPLAAVAREALGVEENPAAEANARRNQELNRVKNVRFRRQDAVRAAADLAAQGRRFDFIVLDPPRTGARGLAPHLSRLAPKDLIYVSCHPAAMARDLAELASFGYRPFALRAYDMFPQTAHLELLAHLKRW